MDPPKVDRTFQKTYYNDTVAFAHDCIVWPEGSNPTEYQEDIWATSDMVQRLAVKSPHGAGKTTTAAIKILQFCLTRDGLWPWKCATTASKKRQLEEYLWPEIHLWARYINWAVIGREPFDMRNELLKLRLTLTTGHAWGMTSNKPEGTEGAHAKRMMWLYDESKAIPDPYWDAAEGAFSTAGEGGDEVLVMAISTPGGPKGRFYEIFKQRQRYAQWEIKSVTLDMAVKAGRVTYEWAEARAKEWGRNSPVFVNRVLGEFAESEEEVLCPVAWIEEAFDRGKAWRAMGKPGQLIGYGVDLGGGGDLSVVSPIYKVVGFDTEKTPKSERINGYQIGDMEVYHKKTLMEMAGIMRGKIMAEQVKACIDVVGIGNGVVQRLRENIYIRNFVIAFSGKQTSEDKDTTGHLGFANKRAAAMWNVRELLHPEAKERLGLPEDTYLLGDLNAPKYRVLSNARVQVEEKDEIRKPDRLGRSPDRGDSVAYAAWLTKKPRRARVILGGERSDISGIYLGI